MPTRSQAGPRRASVRHFRPAVEWLEDRTTPAAVPAAAVTGLPAEVLVGEPASFTVSFDNTSPTDTGYGPYLDLFLRATGADGDDGMTFQSATYLGRPVNATVLTLTAAGVPHPYAKDATGNPVLVTIPPGFQAGDQLVVLELPFGSFTPDQPPAEVAVTVAVSDLADAGVPLAVATRGGFRFGNDSLDNPTIDPSLVGATATATTTPTVIRLTKTYLGPEGETASGPSFTRQYRVDVDVAAGQTVTDLDVTDLIPNNLQFVAVVITGGSTAVVTPSTATPGGTLTRRFASVTGGPGAADASFTFSYYAPIDSGAAGNPPVLDPTTGAPTTAVDDARASATWDPIDPRDATTTVTSDVTANDHTLTIRSVATQKAATVVTDTGTPGPSPGDTIEYVIDFQISDYFAFQNFVVSDVFSAGQAVTGTPTLAVTDGHTGGAPEAAFAGANFTLNPVTRQLEFRVSDELVARLGTGVLAGGAVPVGGTGGGPPPSAPAALGPTTGQIRFRTVIQDSTAAGGVVHNDRVSNDVSVTGDLVSVEDLTTPTGESPSDTSTAGVTIVSGQFDKSIYAVNGNTAVPATPMVAPGDRVTFRLRYTLPISSTGGVAISDFLPLPIFRAGEVVTFVPVGGAASPGAGVAKFGPADTFFALSGVAPTLTTNAAANRIDFMIPAFNAPLNAATEIDLLFTVTVTTDPFADQLLLTNLGQVTETSVTGGPVVIQDIDQVVLQEPLLNIKKGVVARDNPAGVFSPAAVGPVAFNAPGTTGARFAGPITSAGLAATPIDSNLSNVDAGDLVTFAIVVENTGSSPAGAFDVLIQDNLPTGFVVPGIGAQGINLRVTNGAGTLLPFQLVGNSFFGQAGGLRLTDPSATRGAIGPAAADGTNVLIITYDLRVAPTVTVLQTITNVGEVESYAGAPGGPDFTGAGSLSDPAVVSIARDNLLAKQLVGTEVVTATNSNTEAVVGEIVTYRVTLTVPEATMPGAVLTDLLDPQLAFVALDSAVLSTGVSLTGSTTPVVTNNGRTLTFTLGTITNTDRDNAATETIVLTYRAVVVNTTQTNASDQVNNAAAFTFAGLATPKTAAAANVLVIEPQVQIAKSVSVDGGGDTGDAGDPFVYTVVLSNPGGANQFTADAFDLTFRDLFLAGLAGSPLENLAYTVTDTAGLVTAANFQLVTDPVTGRRVLQTPPGSTFDLPVAPARTITIRVTGNVAVTVTPGQIIPNTAEVRWTSLDGDPGQRSPFNPDSTERTGAGGVNDYRATDGAAIHILDVELTKTVVSTSEAATADPAAVVVGEVVRYRVQVAIPEFGTPTAFRFVDALPAGMRFLNDGTGRVAFVTDAGDMLVSSTLTDPDPGNPPDLYLTGDQANVAGLTPEFPVPAAILSFAAAGGREEVTFDLGTVTNPPDPTNDFEYLLVEFNVLVANTAGNQAGVPLVNEVRTFENGVLSGTILSTELRVAEPDFTPVDKSVVSLLDREQPDPGPHDAGDRVRYRVSYANGVGAAVSTAYDARVFDPLPAAKMTLDPASIVVFRNGTQVTTGFTITPAGNAVDVTVAAVAPGDAISVFYEAVLTTAVEAGEAIPNAAALTWTSLPGPAGTAANPTGSATPGVSGAADGERNGSGGVNDYADAGGAVITIASPELTKAVVDTNFPSTAADFFAPALTDLAVGESVLYQFTITLPEGTTNLVLTDQLPFAAGGVLAPVGVVFIPGVTDSFPIPVAQVVVTRADTDGDGIDDRITLDFGTLANAPDGVLNNRDRLIFGLLAQVLDVPQNTDGKVLTNAATIDWGRGTVSDVVSAEVVEPALAVVKSVVAVNGTAVSDAGGPPPVDAGDVVTYRVTVRHAAGSKAPAFDLVLTDALPAGLALVAGSPAIVSAPDYSSVAVPAPTFQVAGNTLTFRADFLDHPTSAYTPGSVDEYVFEYRATVTAAALPGQTVTNTQAMTYRSAPGSAQTLYPNFSRPYAGSDPAAVVVNSSSISGVVYTDLNNNGVYEPGGGDTLITTAVDLVLTGTDSLGTPVNVPLTTTTGTYSFTGLRPGTYAVTQVTQPAGRLDGRDTPGTPFGGTGTPATAPRNPRDADAITTVTIPAGGSAAGVNYNFGEIPAAAVGDFVWHDTNGNGRQDAGEPGLDGVAVTLSGADDTGAAVSRTVTTAGGGAYAFTAVRPGTYAVTFTAPGGFVFTARDSAVATDATDSDADPATGQTAAFTLGVGQSDPTRDAGLYRPVAVGDFVWYDVNSDGVQDAGEPGIPGVTVTLDDAGLDGAFGTADDVTGAAARQTSGAGAYLFANLRPGAYRVRVAVLSLPNGLRRPTFDFDGTGTPHQADSTLASGADNLDVDFGYAPLPQGGDQLGDLVWYDINRDGSSAGEPGISGVGVSATWLGFDDLEGTADDVTFTTATDASGVYGFTNLPLGRFRVSVDPATLPPTRFETFDLDGVATPNTTLAALTLLRPVELDADFGYFSVPAVGDFVWYDFNGDGVQDPDEPGVPGVTVTLTGTAPDGTPINLTRTTGARGRYVFTGIPGGVVYTVTVSNLPAAVTNTFDRDGNRNGQTTFLLGANETVLDADFGYQGNNSLAGFVYRDFNVNGLREPAGVNPETGIPGVPVTLTGTDTKGNPFTRTATTAADGSYLFDGLPDGDFVLAEAQPPSVFAAGQAGYYDGLDTVGSAGGTSPAKNQFAVRFTADIDGVGYNFGENPPADPFGFVYADLNTNGTRDPGEPGIPGVAVTVSGTAFAGTPLARPLTAADVPGGALTVFTDAAGRWEFPVIPPGVYSFVETQPVGYLDGQEEDADPNGPPTTVGDDRFDNVVLFPFPVRGPFNFGERILPEPPTPIPPFDPIPPLPPDFSKRMFLASTVPPAQPPVLTATPNFAAFGAPAVRAISFAVVAEGVGGLVRVFDYTAGTERFRFQPFGDFTGGVRVSTADVTRDGIPDIVTVPGPGGGPILRVFDGNTGAVVLNVMAFDAAFRGGLFVAAADVTGDLVPDLIVTPGVGGGPVVQVYDGTSGGLMANFLALDEAFRGGLRVATGDVNADGTADLLVTAGDGGGPRVAGYDGRFLTTTRTRLFGDVFGFAPELRSGFWIASGDADGDGFADVALGAGEGGAPRVVVYSGRSLATGAGPVAVGSFFAGDPATRSGARVALKDLEFDGRPELLAAPGAGTWPVASVYDPLTGARRDEFYAFPADALGGVFVG